MKCPKCEDGDLVETEVCENYLMFYCGGCNTRKKIYFLTPAMSEVVEKSIKYWEKNEDAFGNTEQEEVLLAEFKSAFGPVLKKPETETGEPK